MTRYGLALVASVGICLQAGAGEASVDERALAAAVEQLRHSIGEWHAVTEFLNPDGSVARTAEGTYEFEWIVPDRVAAGRSDIPGTERSSGILFYLNEGRGTIEMVSVGADGKLWTMTGPAGEETRHSQEFETAEGGRARLRFTRSSVSEDAFDSRMEYTEDGGETWKPGNRQRFRRVESKPDWPWPDSSDAVIAAPDSHVVLLDNDRVRVLEVVVRAGEREPMHTHRWPSAMIVDRAARIRYFDADGKLVFETPADRPVEDGIHTNWLGPEGLHAVENVDTRDFHAIRVELKD